MGFCYFLIGCGVLGRFDIVVYKPQPSKANPESDESTRFVHRVVGLPNKKVEIKKGAIYIDDKLSDEPFEKNVGGKDFPTFTIPDNEYFLLRDNRPNSLHSRYWNKPTIKREEVYEKVTTIIHKEDWDKGRRW